MTLNKNVVNEFMVGEKLISIDTEILKVSKFTIKEISESFVELESIFKDNFPKTFPKNNKLAKIIDIDNTTTLNSLIEMSKNLRRLNKCQGFEEHIKEYNDENKFRHNYFVTLLAGFLLSKVDSLELEPISRDNKRSDIKINLKEIEIYIEHKSINIEPFNYLNVHAHFAKLLIKYLKEIPYRIDINYKYPFSDTIEKDIETLCKEINDKVPSVESEGTIIDNDHFKVQVTRRSEECKEHISNMRYLEESGRGRTKDRFYSRLAPYDQLRVIIKNDYIGDKELYETCLYGTLYDTAENYIYPMHTFFLGGKSYINISGPKDGGFTSVLKQKIKDARSQSPIGKPYILAINMEDELGSIEENRKKLNTIFQPKYNTRYSGILLVKKNDSEVFDLEFVQNPYVENLIPVFLKIKGK